MSPWHDRPSRSERARRNCRMPASRRPKIAASTARGNSFLQDFAFISDGYYHGHAQLWGMRSGGRHTGHRAGTPPRRDDAPVVPRPWIDVPTGHGLHRVWRGGPVRPGLAEGKFSLEGRQPGDGQSSRASLSGQYDATTPSRPTRGADPSPLPIRSVSRHCPAWFAPAILPGWRTDRRYNFAALPRCRAIHSGALKKQASGPGPSSRNRLGCALFPRPWQGSSRTK